MKQYLFLFAWLLIVCNTLSAQPYDTDEVDQLKAFLSQDSKLEGKKNIHILFPGCPDNWETNSALWAGKIDNIVWTVADGKNHVQSINWTASAPTAGNRLCGTLHLEGFNSLTKFECSGQELTGLSLVNCSNLASVEVINNLLTSVDLSGCNALMAVNLDNNQLLLSKLTLPETGNFGLIGSQTVNIGYNLRASSGFDVDLSKEISLCEFPIEWQVDSALVTGSETYYPMPAVPKSDDGGGIYTFNRWMLTRNLQATLTRKDFNDFSVTATVKDYEASIKVSIDAFSLSDMGTVTLYLYDDKGTPIDIQPKLDDAFYFQDMAPGKYILWAETSRTDTRFLPTYYRADHETAPTWKEASVIEITQWDQRKDVWIFFNPELSQELGDITISGKITDGSGIKAQVSRSASVGVYRSKEQSKSILKSSSLVLVKIIYPDSQGNYSFTGLPAGLYYIIPDIAGYAATPIEIDAQAGKSYKDKDFIIDDQSKTIAPNIVMATPDLLGTNLTIYPNPATDVIHITGLQSAYIIKIMNAVGQMVKQETGQSPEAILNVSNQPSGLYLVRIEAGGKSTTRKLIKK